MRFKEFNIKEANNFVDLFNIIGGNKFIQPDDLDNLDFSKDLDFSKPEAEPISYPKTNVSSRTVAAKPLYGPSSKTTQPSYADSTTEIKPVIGPVTSKFGAARKGRSHPGADIGVPSGTKIQAPITGQVTQAVMSSDGCGGTIAISNGKTQHRFCHCSKINVTVGQYVKQGDIVGLTGGGKSDTGRGHSTGPHLHWEKKLASGDLINPLA